MDEAKMRKLIADHAYWSDRKRRLKKEGEAEMTQCTRMERFDDGFGLIATGTSCIALAWGEYRWDDARSMYEDPPDFDQVWNEMIEEGEICTHCQNVRKLKRERVHASKRLGNVRSAITKAGRSLQEETTC